MVFQKQAIFKHYFVSQDFFFSDPLGPILPSQFMCYLSNGDVNLTKNGNF
jgi:hypothetical protein